MSTKLWLNKINMNITTANSLNEFLVFNGGLELPASVLNLKHDSFLCPSGSQLADSKVRTRSYVQQRSELTKWILLTSVWGGLWIKQRGQKRCDGKKKVCIGQVVDVFLGKNRWKSIFFIFYFVQAPWCNYLNQNLFYCLKFYCCKIQLFYVV